MFLTQPALDLTVQAIETGDFGLYRLMIDLPQVLIGDGETAILATDADVLENFQRLEGILRRTRGLRFVCRVLEEEPFGWRLIRATVETRAIRDGVALADPTLGSIVWREAEPHWRAALVVNPVGRRLAGGWGAGG